MVHIRPEQMQQLDQHALDVFAARVARYLRAHLLPQTASMSDQQMLVLARNGILCAESFGISVEWDLCRFVQHQLRLGPNFHAGEAWANSILKKAELDGTSKVDRLDHYYFYVLNKA